MRTLAFTVLFLLGAGAPAAAAEDDPPNRTGCCMSFSDSPPTVVFCLSENACRFETAPPPR